MNQLNDFTPKEKETLKQLALEMFYTLDTKGGMGASARMENIIKEAKKDRRNINSARMITVQAFADGVLTFAVKTGGDLCHLAPDYIAAYMEGACIGQKNDDTTGWATNVKNETAAIQTARIERI